MSNDFSIHSLHNDILRKLPFSVSGNASIERTVYKFLQEVAESPFLVSNKQVVFVMGGFAKINLQDISELFQQKWETERLRSFFYYDYEDDHVEPILSLYQHCLGILTSGLAGTSKVKNITNIICDNNQGGVNFRVRVVDKDQDSKIKITHIRRDRVLEAQIPAGYYQKKFSRAELSEALTGDNITVVRSKLNHYEYFRSESTQLVDEGLYETVIDKFFREGRDPENFKVNYADFVLNATENENRFLEHVFKNDSAKINEIYFLFYVAGLLAYLMECDIEYFTSVSNNLGDKKYSLGSIAVGYKREHGSKLSNDVRAFFNIVSNHIAQNLATQILLDSTRMQYYISKRKEQEQFVRDIFNRFHKSIWPHDGHIDGAKSERVRITNGNIPIAEDGSITLDKNKFTRDEIEKSFGKGFLQYLNDVLHSTRIDYGLYQGFHASAECCKQLNLFYEKFHATDCSGSGLKLFKKQIDPTEVASTALLNQPYANVYLPHRLIQQIQNDDKRKETTITTFMYESSALIYAEYKMPVSIATLIEQLDGFNKTGAGLGEKDGGSFHKFIHDHYDAFRICGDFVIRGLDDGCTTESISSLLNENHPAPLSDFVGAKFAISFKRDFKSISAEDGRVTYAFVGNPNSIDDVTRLLLEIKYNLF